MEARNKAIFIIIWMFFVLLICWYSTSYSKHYSIHTFPVTGDIFKFSISGKTGLIDVSNGEVIVKPTYEDIRWCNQVNEICRTELNNKYGIIDFDGNVLISNQYDEIHFDNNQIVLVKDKKYSIIDIHGNLLLGPMEEGIVIKRIISQYVIITKDQQNSVIDIHGNIIVDYLPFNIRISYIDSTNQIVYIENRYNNKNGFINLKENIIVEPVYERLWGFVDDIALAELNNKYGFINDKNEVKTEFIYDKAHEFSEGLALVQYNSKFGYIDQLGNVMIDYQYDHALDFIDGVAHVEFGNSDAFINKNNEKIIPIHNSSHEIEYINQYDSTDNTKYYYVNDDGSIFYKNWDEDYGLIIDEKKIINQKGDIILDKHFKKIRYINDNMFCIETTGWQCYNMEGKKLLEHDFFYYNSYEDSPFIHFSDHFTHYVYDKNCSLIYKSSIREGNVYFSQSNNFIVTTKGNKIISYNTKTKEKKVIYKKSFTIESLYKWR
ncbi:WG repeat-containing protein [Mycoplasmatota bacterium]|nr:WG repeat-containing protein [Mycoplasmatota bacterium]